MELVDLNPMPKQDITLLPHLIGKNITAIHLLVKFGDLGLDDARGAIGVY
jgi:hypothetical protein